MANIPQAQIHKYLRHDKKFPHVWCPGCSNGIVLGATIRAISELGYEKDNVAMVSRIGCSSRMPVYVDFNTLHSLHGRAIAYATGAPGNKYGFVAIFVHLRPPGGSGYFDSARSPGPVLSEPA